MPGLRLLFLVGTSDIGGTERFLTGLVKRLDPERFSSAICVIGEPGPLAHDYKSVSERLWHLRWGTNSFGRVLSDWKSALRSWRPDVVTLFGLRANLLGRFVNGGVPVINALRGAVIDEKGRPMARRLDRATFGRVRLCVSNSQAALTSHVQSGFPADRFVYIPNGVDTAPFRAPVRSDVRVSFDLRPDEILLLTVGNLLPVKNHALLLHASRMVHDRGIAHRIWIAGKGPERPLLEKLVDELSLGPHVHFLGTPSDLVERYVAADVFVLSSRFEGMPNVILEACAAGLPIVATAVGEVPAMCRESGLLVPEGDSQAMADALVRVIRDLDLRASLSAGARQTAERFAWPDVVDRYSRIFEQVAWRVKSEA